MDDKKKILLGSEDIISRNVEDIFLDVNLTRTFSEYKKEKFDNTFDLAKQFDEERNACRNFRIYGTVNSIISDGGNAPYEVYSNSGLTQIIQNMAFTTPTSYPAGINVFNKRIGKYLISLDNFTGNSIFIKFLSTNAQMLDQVFEQKLVFYDNTGEFIPYGTKTIEIDENLNTIEVDNDFPFFYNKHWVKKNIYLSKIPV